MKLLLERVYNTNSTSGILFTATQRFFTISQPWRDNMPGRSCVPEGIFALLPFNSPKHGQTWAMHNPKLGVTIDGAGDTRSYCLLHSMNFAEQSEGCIGVGLHGDPMFDPVLGLVTPAIENSKAAMASLIVELGAMSTGHTLTIVKADLV